MPGDSVGRLVEAHSIAGPKGDQGTQLVPNWYPTGSRIGILFQRRAELGGWALGDIEVGGDGDASDA